jgi:hypothetical protein
MYVIGREQLKDRATIRSLGPPSMQYVTAPMFNGHSILKIMLCENVCSFVFQAYRWGVNDGTISDSRLAGLAFTPEQLFFISAAQVTVYSFALQAEMFF